MEITYGKNKSGNLVATATAGETKAQVEIIASHWSSRLLFILFPHAVAALHEGGMQMGRAVQTAIHAPDLARLAEIDAKAARNRGTDGRFTAGQPKPAKPPRQRGANGQFIKSRLAADPT